MIFSRRVFPVIGATAALGAFLTSSLSGALAGAQQERSVPRVGLLLNLGPNPGLEKATSMDRMWSSKAVLPKDTQIEFLRLWPNWSNRKSM